MHRPHAISLYVPGKCVAFVGGEEDVRILILRGLRMRNHGHTRLAQMGLFWSMETRKSESSIFPTHRKKNTDYFDNRLCKDPFKVLAT
jgi:hypothetical protein